MLSTTHSSSLLFFFFLMIRRPPRSTLFPTRRSSDLGGAATARRRIHGTAGSAASERLARAGARYRFRRLRSEEHTSELQSQSNLVCRLLLEKKKNNE